MVDLHVYNPVRKWTRSEACSFFYSFAEKQDSHLFSVNTRRSVNNLAFVYFYAISLEMSWSMIYGHDLGAVSSKNGFF